MEFNYRVSLQGGVGFHVEGWRDTSVSLFMCACYAYFHCMLMNVSFANWVDGKSDKN